MGVTKLFNRLIDIELYSDSESFKITCPTTGRKPDITIHGTILPSNNLNDFEIRVKNLYLSNIQKYNKIKVSCGYESEKATTIIGSITNTYIENPAPDMTTVFTCVMGSFEQWISKTVDVKYKEGEKLTDILKDLTKSLGFYEPHIADDITESLKAPMNESGLAKDVLQKLRQSFPSVTITVESNRIIASKSSGTGKIYELKYLSSPPQLGGGSVTLTSLWEPRLRADDYIKISTKFFKKDMTVSLENPKTEYRISSIQFEFSTVGSENSMTIQGTY